MPGAREFLVEYGHIFIVACGLLAATIVCVWLGNKPRPR